MTAAEYLMAQRIPAIARHLPGYKKKPHMGRLVSELNIMPSSMDTQFDYDRLEATLGRFRTAGNIEKIKALAEAVKQGGGAINAKRLNSFLAYGGLKTVKLLKDAVSLKTLANILAADENGAQSYVMTARANGNYTAFTRYGFVTVPVSKWTRLSEHGGF